MRYFYSMRKFLVCIISLFSLISAPLSATAATQQVAIQQVKATFKSLTVEISNALDALESEYESKIDQLDAALLEATQNAERTASNEILALNNLYLPQIATSAKKLQDTKANFSNVAKVRITNSTTVQTSRVGLYLKCPEPWVPLGNQAEYAVKECANTNGYPRPGDKSIKFPGTTIYQGGFEKGDITEIVIEAITECVGVTNCGGSEKLESGLADKAIELITPNEFELTRSILVTETLNSNSISAKLTEGKKKIESKRVEAIARAKIERQSQLEEITDNYKENKASLENQLQIAEDANAAARRAAKNPEMFDKAFSVAYKFEYNRRKLTEISDSEWTGKLTFRTIDSLKKVVNLAKEGDSIAGAYSFQKALSFNSRVGIGFTGEPEFRATLKVVISKYQKATGRRVSITA